MAAKVKQLFWIVGLVLLFVNTVSGRIHKTIKLEHETRSQIPLSKFGFFKGGLLQVNMTGLTIPDAYKDTGGEDQIFGFSLDKTVSDGISSYLEKHTEECMLSKQLSTEVKQGVNMVLFIFNLNNNSVTIERHGTDLEELGIYENEPTYWKFHRPRRSVDEIPKTPDGQAPDSAKPPEGEHIVSPDVVDHPHNIVSPKPIPASGADIPKPPSDDDKTDDQDTINKIMSPDEGDKEEDDVVVDGTGGIEENFVPKADPSLGNVEDAVAAVPENPIIIPKEAVSTSRVLVNTIPMQKQDQVYALSFVVGIDKEKEVGLYNLYFHNCQNLKGEHDIPVRLTLNIKEVNLIENYLSAGEIPLPTLFFTMSVVFFLAACFWAYVLRKDKDDVFKIHYLMLSLIYVKSLSLLFHAIDYHFIAKFGNPIEAWAIMYYITHLLKGSLLFITIVLIGAGWAFIKHILTDKDKKIFMIVIPLQILANVAYIIIESSEEGQSEYYTWKEIFILVDLLCCGAILFPVVWSIRHLQEASSTDGKAAISLKKLKLFRHFYIMIVCYIYFTRIIVYLLKITVPFQYIWLDDFFKEVATFIFFVVTAYKFRPASNNPYLQVDQEDDDIKKKKVPTATLR